MKYLLCFILPPVAVLLTGRPFTAVLNFLFTLCFWLPGIVHALIIVSHENKERRHAETIAAMTGRPVARRLSEWQLVKGVAAVGLMFLIAGVAASLLAARTRARTSEPSSTEPEEVMQPMIDGIRASEEEMRGKMAGKKPAPHVELQPQERTVQPELLLRISTEEALAPFVEREFEIEKSGGQAQIQHACEKKMSGVVWRVMIYSPAAEPQRVKVISAMLINEGNAEAETTPAAKPLLALVAGLFNDIGARDWINDHLGEEAETQIGTVKYQLFAKGRTRTLRITGVADRNAEALVAMEGKTLAEIEGTHGKALSKDAATGWAEWPNFRARFVTGKVVEVSVK
jgi:uncharacterized membrane protein YqaE (UPF0057 family)